MILRSSRISLRQVLLQHFEAVDSWAYSELHRPGALPDQEFYSSPRIGVHHVDEISQASLTQFYDNEFLMLQQGASKGLRALDICSSWTSHYPSQYFGCTSEEDWTSVVAAEQAYGRSLCVGVGMNAKELQANPLLHDLPGHCGRWTVLDLNDKASWREQVPSATSSNNGRARGRHVPLELKGPGQVSTSLGAATGISDSTLDVVTCSLSIEYLTHPLQVVREAGLLLRPGGVLMIAVSNRCFPTQSVGPWLEFGPAEKICYAADVIRFSGDTSYTDGSGGIKCNSVSVAGTEGGCGTDNATQVLRWGPIEAWDLTSVGPQLFGLPNSTRCDPLFVIQASRL